MLKKKYLIIVVVTLLAVGGSAWWFMRPDNKKLTYKPETSKTPYVSQTLNAADNSNSISLTNPMPKPQPKNSLLNSSPTTASDQTGLNPLALNNNSRSNNSAEATLDPKTFSQHDKYKDDKAALFADLHIGDGEELTANKKAAVYYRGWLTDGTLFDASRPDEKGELQPFMFTLGAHQVITGWEQALTGMKVGGVRFVIVPPAVGYGAQGQDSIPGNSVLIFQVQLLAVE